MDRLDRPVAVPPDGAGKQIRSRCEKCKRFARLWPGESQCDRCNGALPLEYIPGRGERR